MHVTFANKYTRSTHNNPIVLHSYRFDVCFFTMNNHTLFQFLFTKILQTEKSQAFPRNLGVDRPQTPTTMYAPGILLLGFLSLTIQEVHHI